MTGPRRTDFLATVAAPTHEGAPTPGPELTVVVPTRNEHDNVRPVYDALCRTLQGIDWEAIFVDDDSQDGTPEAVCRLASLDRRVRCIQRIGRRGLASACVEGILASSAPYVAVMDADLQHDEQLLPHMLKTLKTEPTVDAVVGSRYVEHGSIGIWSRHRAWLSSIATRIGRSILQVPIADPMSGFFMVRREAFQGSVRRLSSIGFKILLDILASSPRPLQVKEIPFHFRERHAGESKFDALIGWEYLMLLADKVIGHIIPIRFFVFALVGGLGLVVHLARVMALPQPHAAELRAQPGNGNWGCNNRKFHAQQLADLPRSPPDRMEVRARALVIRIDLQLRGSRECRHRHLAVHPAAFVLVGRGHRWRGHELRVELCRELDLHLARPVTLDLADLVSAPP